MEILLLKNRIKECTDEKEKMFEEKVKWNKIVTNALCMINGADSRRDILEKRIDVLTLLIEEMEYAMTEKAKITNNKHVHDISGLFNRSGLVNREGNISTHEITTQDFQNTQGLTHIHGGSHTSTIDISANGFVSEVVKLIEDGVCNELNKER